MFDRFLDDKHVQWARAVKKRDKYCCFICQRIDHLEAHHIYSYDIHIDKRYNLSNGVCLDRDCHTRFHDIYGRGNNTRAQFEEYLVFLKMLNKKATEIYKEEQQDGYIERRDP
jgi:5-methylcytosine-specific restriction endonuclease McrA